jgi:hypothetical protein
MGDDGAYPVFCGRMDPLPWGLHAAGPCGGGRPPAAAQVGVTAQADCASGLGSSGRHNGAPRDDASASNDRPMSASVTPEFKSKPEFIEYMCARIKLHTCIDSVNTENSAKSV